MGKLHAAPSQSVKALAAADSKIGAVASELTVNLFILCFPLFYRNFSQLLQAEVFLCLYTWDLVSVETM